MPLSERDVTLQVRDYLVKRGWRALRQMSTIVPGAFAVGSPGIPDYLFLHYLDEPLGAAAVLWVEFKSPRPGSKRSADQIKWQEREHRRGAVVVTVYEFDAFEEWYRKTFAWLHAIRGQQEFELVAGIEEKW
jgi:hypothetical protein